MKFFLTILALASFVAISVFGFVAMGNDHTSQQTLCLANVAKALGCADKDGTNILHAKIFRAFSSAILNALQATTSLAILAGLLLLVFLLLAELVVRFSFSTVLLGYDQPQSQRQMIRWLRLLEKRDPATP